MTDPERQQFGDMDERIRVENEAKYKEMERQQEFERLLDRCESAAIMRSITSLNWNHDIENSSAKEHVLKAKEDWIQARQALIQFWEEGRPELIQIEIDDVPVTLEKRGGKLYLKHAENKAANLRK